MSRELKPIDIIDIFLVIVGFLFNIIWISISYTAGLTFFGFVTGYFTWAAGYHAKLVSNSKYSFTSISVLILAGAIQSFLHIMIFNYDIGSGLFTLFMFGVIFSSGWSLCNYLRNKEKANELSI